MELKKIYKRPYNENQIQRVEQFCKLNNLVYAELKLYDNYVTFVGYSNISYNELVNKLIAERYTIQDELAIQRKHHKGVNNVEFEEYDTYVEECKAKAKAFIEERDNISK